jgi:adenosylmethionine-8-amino-7-oxononanoate aminotransferase
MANPLACAVALENLNLLASYDWAERVAAIAQQLAVELAPCRDLPAVKEVRVLGAIGVVELHQPVDMAVVQPQFVAQGVWLRPFGRLIYTMPPYIIEPQQLGQITKAIGTVVASLP